MTILLFTPAQLSQQTINHSSVLFTAATSANGLCSRGGNVQPSKRISGHTIANHAVHNRMQCIALCAQTAGCG